MTGRSGPGRPGRRLATAIAAGATVATLGAILTWRLANRSSEEGSPPPPIELAPPHDARAPGPSAGSAKILADPPSGAGPPEHPTPSARALRPPLRPPSTPATSDALPSGAALRASSLESLGRFGQSMRSCLEAGYTGTFTVQIVLGPDGLAGAAIVDQAAGADPPPASLLACIADAVWSTSWPAAIEETKVAYRVRGAPG